MNTPSTNRYHSIGYTWVPRNLVKPKIKTKKRLLVKHFKPYLTKQEYESLQIFVQNGYRIEEALTTLGKAGLFREVFSTITKEPLK